MPDDWNADTEWNDILRAKGIIPEKEFTEEEIVNLVDETMEKKYGVTAGGEKILEHCSLDELRELEDEIDLDEDDRILEQYKKQRLAELHQLARKEIFGSVTQISKPDYQKEVTDASKDVPVVILLFQNPLPSCKLVLAHLDTLARTHRAVKFLKIVADQCIPNYPDRNCPTMIIYKDGDLKANLVGIQSLGGINTRAYDLERILVGYGVIQNGLLAPSGAQRGESDDEEEDDRPFSGIRISRSGGRTARQDEGDDGWD
ncbi:thioredoxin-like protein [Obelidium mucronatum]|nr:thioredoxin-like protein [Obelidium mucronatum]